MKIEGTITAADYEKFKSLVDQAHREAKSKNWDWDGILVYVDSPGGNVAAAMAIGRLLRKEQAHIWIGYHPLHSQGICYSACIFVLAGAVGRHMQDGRVGIHRPYLEVPKDAVSGEKVSARFQKLLRDMREYFHEMNVSEQLADAMLRIDPENIVILNNAALITFGLTAEDPIARETKELQIAQKYGLSRQEYMKRRALAASRCANPSTLCYQKIIETGRVDPHISPDEVDFSQFGRPVR